MRIYLYAHGTGSTPEDAVTPECELLRGERWHPDGGIFLLALDSHIACYLTRRQLTAIRDAITKTLAATELTLQRRPLSTERIESSPPTTKEPK